MGGLGLLAALVAAVAVWRQSRRSGQRLGLGLGCLLAGAVVLVLLECAWMVAVTLSGSNLGLDVP